MPLYFKSLQIISIPTITATTTGATLLYTTENGTRKFYCVAISLECTTATLVTIPPTVSIGTNSTSYNNIMVTTLATGLLATALHFPIPINTASTVIPANTGIYVNVTTGATATAQTITVHLVGFYS